MTRAHAIPVPYEGDQELAVDPGAVGVTWNRALDSLRFLIDTSEIDPPEEMERVMRAAIILYHAQPGCFTFAECLETAIIWERG